MLLFQNSMLAEFLICRKPPFKNSFYIQKFTLTSQMILFANTILFSDSLVIKLHGVYQFIFTVLAIISGKLHNYKKKKLIISHQKYFSKHYNLISK